VYRSTMISVASSSAHVTWYTVCSASSMRTRGYEAKAFLHYLHWFAKLDIPASWRWSSFTMSMVFLLSEKHRRS
jgi:hypothetical protein